MFQYWLCAGVVAALVLAVPAAAADLKEQWFAAARKGDVNELRSLIAKGAAVDATWRYETTALLITAFRGHGDAARLLVEHGADVNRKDSFYGMTPITAAASQGNAGLVKMLLGKGARDRDSALLIAASGGKREVVETLLAGDPLPAAVLSKSLAAAQSNKHQAVAELLAKAQSAEEAALERCAGVYRSSSGEEVQCAVKESKLHCGVDGPTDLLEALSATEFKTAASSERKISFELEDGKAISATWTARSGEKIVYRRVQ